jgi:hypothetical protein
MDAVIRGGERRRPMSFSVACVLAGTPCIQSITLKTITQLTTKALSQVSRCGYEERIHEHRNTRCCLNRCPTHVKSANKSQDQLMVPPMVVFFFAEIRG